MTDKTPGTWAEVAEADATREHALETLAETELRYAMLLGGSLVVQGEPDPSKGLTWVELTCALRHKIKQYREALGLPPPRNHNAQQATDEGRVRLVSVVASWAPAASPAKAAVVLQGPGPLLACAERWLRDQQIAEGGHVTLSLQWANGVQDEFFLATFSTKASLGAQIRHALRNSIRRGDADEVILATHILNRCEFHSTDPGIYPSPDGPRAPRSE